MKYFFRARKYFYYWLDEVNEHSLHSPYLYELYTKVIARDGKKGKKSIEDLRQRLLKDNRLLEYSDPGASELSIRRRYVKSIARASLSDVKFSCLYSRLIENADPSFVVELGTSLGINSLYLAQPAKPVYTFEGVPALCEISIENFNAQQAQNIHLIEGNIDKTLPLFLEKHQKLDFVFFDANHTYEATLRYFQWCVEKAAENSIFIFDDIYWSEGMAKAWNEIKNDSAVQVTLDLYRCGIVLFNKSLTPQHIAVSF